MKYVKIYSKKRIKKITDAYSDGGRFKKGKPNKGYDLDEALLIYCDQIVGIDENRCTVEDDRFLFYGIYVPSWICVEMSEDKTMRKYAEHLV